MLKGEMKRICLPLIAGFLFGWGLVTLGQSSICDGTLQLAVTEAHECNGPYYLPHEECITTWDAMLCQSGFCSHCDNGHGYYWDAWGSICEQDIPRCPDPDDYYPGC